MKKNYFASILVLSVLFTLNAQVPLDDIESYPEGPLFSGPWGTWDAVDGDQNAIVSTDVAASGTKSIKLEGGATQDVIFNQGIEATSGTWSTQWKMYIPKGNSAYFNIQGNVTPSAGANLVFVSPGIEFNFNNETPGEGVVLDTNETFVFPHNEWFTVTVIVTIDETDVDFGSFYEVFLNDENIGTSVQQVPFFYPFQSPAPDGEFNGYDAINFFPNGGLEAKFYVDDIEFKQGNILSTDSFSIDTFSAYPNPVKDMLTISSSKNESIDSIKIYDLLGKQVLETSPENTSSRIDMSAFNSGIYLVKITTDKGANQVIRIIR